MNSIDKLDSKTRIVIITFFILFGISTFFECILPNGERRIKDVNNLTFKYSIIAVAIKFLMIYVLYLFRKHIIPKNQDTIKGAKNSLYAFLVCYLILFIPIVLSSVKLINFETLDIYIIRFMQVIFLLSLFLCYLFKIKFTDFGWNITIKQILVVIFIAFSIILLPKLIINKELALKYYLNFNRDNLRYLSSVIIVFIYPALYEEFLFRGLLISGLKGFFYNEHLINIIQATIFGLMHFSLYIERGFGIWSPVFIGSQVILGYLLGSLYLKTRSLTPSIILHTLFDIL